MYNPYKTFKRIVKTPSGKTATRKTKYVIKLILHIYIPVIMMICIVTLYNIKIAMLIISLMILSCGPVAKRIIIPYLSDKL